MMVLMNGMPRRSEPITGVLAKAILRKNSYGTKITTSPTLCIVIINTAVHTHTTTMTQMRTATTTFRILMSLKSHGKSITTPGMKTLTTLITTGFSTRTTGRSNLTHITRRTKRKRRSLLKSQKRRPTQAHQ